MSLIFLWVLLKPQPGLAEPIAMCQRLLADQRSFMALIEEDTYLRLRTPPAEIPGMTRGLMIALYLQRDHSLPIHDALQLVPATSTRSVEILTEAARQGFLSLDKRRTGGITVVRSGPRLNAYVDTELTRELASILVIERSMVGEAEALAGLPRRSRKLDRLLLAKMLSDYIHAWQIGAPVTNRFLRHAYGLMTYLYRQADQGAGVDRKHSHDLMTTPHLSLRIRYLRQAFREGFLELHQRTAGIEPLIRAGPKLAPLVEDRINQNIRRFNLIRRLLHRGE